LNKSELNRITQELLRRSGSSVAVQLDGYFPGGRLVGGKYAIGNHSVTMYTEVIRQQCLQLFGSLEQVYAYYAVVFAHELGHSMDVQLSELCDLLDSSVDEQEYMRILRQIEENAWNLAMPWISDMDPSLVKMIVDQSLEAYREEPETIIA